MSITTPPRLPLVRGYRRLPRWLRVGLSLLAIGLGAYLITRPTTSLNALALAIGAGFVLQGLLVLDSGDVRAPPNRLWERVARFTESALWIGAGLFVFFFVGLTVRLLAVVIAIALMTSGVIQIVDALRRAHSLDSRIAGSAFGTASIGFGVIAAFWPDITLLIAAVAFGAQLIVAGTAEARRALHGAPPARRPPGALRRFARTTAAIVTVALVAVVGAVSINLRGGTPVVDEFYAAPREVPDDPGELIRAEPFTRDVPANATGWRILYTTTRGDGSPAVASGIVVVPTDGIGYWPTIGWAHGTTGFAQHCAPSLLQEPFGSGALFVLPRIIDAGWALVATDYVGLGTIGPHPYLIGTDTAHSVLDALRAARHLQEAKLGRKSVIWGHSQGGAAVLWAGALVDEYAPTLRIEGVAALAPASELPRLIGRLPNVRGGSVLASFAVASFTANYPDLSWGEYIRPGAEPIVRAMSGRCLEEPGVLVSVLQSLALSRDPVIFTKNPRTGAFGARIAENIPQGTIAAPLLITQGETDALVSPSAQQAFVDRIRSRGQQVDYRTYAKRDHVGLVFPRSPMTEELFAWTAERFAGITGDPD